MVHGNVLVFAAVVCAALCRAPVTAYPTSSMERVSGDNNYQPLRNSASRDFERFIDFLCVDDVECGASGVAAANQGTLDPLNGGHVMAAKRDSLDRLNGGHVMAAKRDSLDRLNGGHVMAAKRDSLDRLNGGHVMAAKRDSLDRLNGGHVMQAKRRSLDRLNGGHVMQAKRDSLDRLNGILVGYAAADVVQPDGQAKRSSPSTSTWAVAAAASRRPAGVPSPSPRHHRRRLRSSASRSPGYVRLHRWTDLVESDGGLEYDLENDDENGGYDDDTECADCGDGRPTRSSSSSF